MRTDDLIEFLSEDVSETWRPIRFAPWVFLGVALSAALLIVLPMINDLTIRPDYFERIDSSIIGLKQLFPLLLALLAFPLMRKAAYPETRLKFSNLVVILPFVLAMVGIFLWGFGQTPNEARAMAMAGKSLNYCVVYVPIFALPVFVSLLMVLHRGAPSRPMGTGFLAGLVAGGIGCAIYAFTCVDDSPLFWSWAYSLGILIAAGMGALIGKFVLKW